MIDQLIFTDLEKAKEYAEHAPFLRPYKIEKEGEETYYVVSRSKYIAAAIYLENVLGFRCQINQDKRLLKREKKQPIQPLKITVNTPDDSASPAS